VTSKATQQLTPLELEIMKVLWDLGEGSVRAVQSHGLLESRSLAYNTVQTMLNILVRKKRLKRVKCGKAYVYRPLIGRSQVTRAVLGDLIDRFFGGDAERLVLGLVETRHLTPERLAALQSLIEEEKDSNDHK